MRELREVIYLGGMPMLVMLGLLLTLTPKETAQLEHEQELAQAAVIERHGKRSLAQMSQDERREFTKEMAAAAAAVLAAHQVEAREWMAAHAKQGREEREALAQARDQVKQEAARAAAEAEERAKVKPKAAEEVLVQRGFGEQRPVVMEEAEGAPPIVEKGIPQEVKDDQEAAAEQDRAEGFNAAAAKAVRTHRSKK